MATATAERTDPGEILAFAVEQRRTAGRAEVNVLVAAVEFAGVHSFLDQREFGPSRGVEQTVRLGGEGTPEVAEFAAAEFGAELEMTSYAAKRLMGDGLDLQHRLPMTWTSVQMLLAPAWLGRKVASMTRHLSRRAARYVDEAVGADAGTMSPGRFLDRVEAAIIKADPAAADARARQARSTQGVFLGHSNEAGLKSAFIRAQVPTIIVFDAVVARIAEALAVLGDTRSVDQRRAEAVRIMANPAQVIDLFAQAAQAAGNTAEAPEPQTPAFDPQRWLQPATLYVHLNQDCFEGREDGVVRMEGVGPITVAQSCDFLGHANVTVKPVVDLADTRASDAYEAPSRLWEQMFLRNPAEVFPFGTHLGRRKDVDHPEPYVSPDNGGPPAQTHAGNFAFLGRRHHRIKTHGGWSLWQPREGVYLWSSPHGAVYLVDSHGTRKVRAASRRAAAAG